MHLAPGIRALTVLTNSAAALAPQLQFGPVIRRDAGASDLACFDPDCKAADFPNVHTVINHWMFEHTPAWAPTTCFVCPIPHNLHTTRTLRYHLTPLLQGDMYCVGTPHGLRTPLRLRMLS